MVAITLICDLDMPAVAERLLLARRRAGLTQAEVAYDRD